MDSDIEKTLDGISGRLNELLNSYIEAYRMAASAHCEIADILVDNLGITPEQAYSLAEGMCEAAAKDKNWGGVQNGEEGSQV